MRHDSPLLVIDAMLEATPAVLTTVTIPCDGHSIAHALTLSIGRLAQFVQRHGLTAVSAPRTLYQGYRDHATTVTIALPIERPHELPLPTPLVRVGELAPLRGWRFEHRGAYDDLPTTYARISAWLVGQGVIASESEWARLLPICEEYVSDPAHTPARELLTYLYVSRRDATT